MEVVPNVTSIPPSAYNHVMSMLADDGKTLAFGPCICKEIFCRNFCIGAVFNNRLGGNLAADVFRYGRIGLEKPTIVMWKRLKQAAKVANHVQDVLDMLNECMKLRRSIVKILEGEDAFLVEVDPWYLRSSVSLHGILTFIRMGAQPESFPVKSHIASFLESARRKGCNDGQQVHQALNNDNLYGFINRTLPALDREGLSDWTANRGTNDYPTIRLDGIAGYNRHWEAQTSRQMTDKELNQYVGLLPSNFVRPPGDRYVGWAGCQYMTVTIPAE